MIRQKTWPPVGVGLIFCIYLYRKLWNSSCQIPPDRFQCCFGVPLPRMFKQSWFVKKHSCWEVGLIFPIYLDRQLWKSSCQKPLNRFQFNLARMFLWWPSIKFFQAVMIRQKKKQQKNGYYGVGLYSYIKHFKNLFVRNHWTNFNITWQKCSFGDPLSRLSCHDVLKRKKTWLLLGVGWGVGEGGAGL